MIYFLVVKGCIIDPVNFNDPGKPVQSSPHWNCLDCDQPFHYPAFVYTLTAQKDPEKLGSDDVLKSPLCLSCVAETLKNSEMLLLNLYKSTK